MPRARQRAVGRSATIGMSWPQPRAGMREAGLAKAILGPDTEYVCPDARSSGSSSATGAEHNWARRHRIARGEHVDRLQVALRPGVAAK